MLNNYKRQNQQKNIVKTTFILPIICISLLGGALFANTIANKYDHKLGKLSTKINLEKDKTLKIQAENTTIKNSIENLDSLIKELEDELN